MTSETVPGEGSSDAVGEFEIDGEKFTAEQLREAIEAWRDRSAWEQAYKQRDQRFAAVRNAIEAGFGKRLSDLTPSDIRDIQAMGIINAKIREEPAFARAWEESLFEAYRKAGLTAGQAREAAKQDVADAKAGEAARLPEDVLARLRKVDELENLYIEQSLEQFRNLLEDEIQGSIQKFAGDLAQRFGPTVRMMVLHGIQGYSDVELLEKYRDGELQREIAALARQSAQALRDHLSEGSASKAQALQKAKEGVPPVPFKGGAAEPVEEPEPKPGAGLARMTERFRRSFVGR